MGTFVKRTTTTVSIVALIISGGVATASVASAIPAPAKPTCSPASPANKALMKAYNKTSNVIKAGSDFTVTKTNLEDKVVTLAVTEKIDIQSKTFNADYIYDGNKKTRFIGVAGDKVDTLYQRVGDGYQNRILTQDTPNVLNAQITKMRTQLNAPNMQWLKSTTPANKMSPSQNALKSFQELGIDEFAKGRCFTVVPQHDNTVLYHSNGLYVMNFLVNSNGTVARMTTHSKDDYNLTYVTYHSFNYDNINLTTPEPNVVVNHDRNTDAVLNKIFVSDTGKSLADAVVFNYGTAPRTVAELRKNAYELRDESNGVYRLGIGQRNTPYSRTTLDWFLGGGYAYPFSVSNVPNGVKVLVVAGSSRAVYNITMVKGKVVVTKVYSD